MNNLQYLEQATQDALYALRHQPIETNCITSKKQKTLLL